MDLYQIDTGYACGGIVVDNGIVTEAAPIFKWMLHKSFDEIKEWQNIKWIAHAGELLS